MVDVLTKGTKVRNAVPCALRNPPFHVWTYAMMLFHARCRRHQFSPGRGYGVCENTFKRISAKK